MEDMRPEEMRRFLATTRLGVLGLARGDHAYAVPIFFGWDGKSFYFHGRDGRKATFIDATEEACLTVVHAESEDVWASVMAYGRVEEVLDEHDRLAAMDALMAIPLPPEFGVSEFGEPRHSAENAHLWRLTPHQMTGRKSLRQVAGQYA